MTREEKDLVLQDLCGRLPYGVKCKHKLSDYKEVLDGIKHENAFCYFIDCEPCLVEDIKPYLFPMSSMTDEQKTEWDYIDYYADHHEAVDWLNKNHFDYRGLIDMGLALDATGLNIY